MALKSRYVRVVVGHARDEKFAALRAAQPRAYYAAHHLWVLGLEYCAEHLTDGVIPSSVVPMLDAGLKPRRAKDLAALLVAHRLWHEDDRGFRVGGYLEHQVSKADIDAKRESNRSRKRAERQRTGARTEPNGNGSELEGNRTGTETEPNGKPDFNDSGGLARMSQRDSRAREEKRVDREKKVEGEKRGGESARPDAGDAHSPPPHGVLVSEFADVVFEVTGQRIGTPDGPRALDKAKAATRGMTSAEVLDDVQAFAAQLGDPARWPSWPFGRYIEHAGRWRARANGTSTGRPAALAKRVVGALRDAERAVGGERRLPKFGIFTPYANQVDIIEQAEEAGILRSEAERFVELVLVHRMHIEHKDGLVHDFVDGMRGLGWGDVLAEREQEIRREESRVRRDAPGGLPPADPAILASIGSPGSAFDRHRESEGERVTRREAKRTADRAALARHSEAWGVKAQLEANRTKPKAPPLTAEQREAKRLAERAALLEHVAANPAPEAAE